MGFLPVILMGAYHCVAHISIHSGCVDGRYNVYMFILTTDILSSHACHAKGYTIYSLVLVPICT
jgi:hypothetical protein